MKFVHLNTLLFLDDSDGSENTVGLYAPNLLPQIGHAIF